MKSKILIIFCIVILLSSFILINNVYAANYDLSDYKNQNLMNGSWFIYHSENENLIYLVTTDNTSRPYLTCYLSGGYDWSSMGELGNCSNMGGFYRYTFNTSTSKFEDKEHIDNGCLNIGNPTDKIIASGCNLYTYQSWISFFQQTPVPLVVNIQPKTVTQVLEKTQVMEVWKNLMKTLVVSLIVFLVGLVGLRKAWTFLKTALRKA